MPSDTGAAIASAAFLALVGVMIFRGWLADRKERRALAEIYPSLAGPNTSFLDVAFLVLVVVVILGGWLSIFQTWSEGR